MTRASEPTPEFLAAADAWGLAFDAGDLDRIGTLLALLLEANARFNLTSITDPAEAWMKHVFDSLTLLPWIEGAGPKRVIDVGSGGGFPGLALAIALPGVAFALVEATGKKAEFLRGAAAELGVANVSVIADRAETIGRDPAHREAYDLATARAVGPLAVLLELASPLVRVGGHVLSIKGAKAAQEIEEAAEAMSVLHCRLVETKRTPTGTVVVVEKTGRTPKPYPRRPGEPKRSPLRRR